MMTYTDIKFLGDFFKVTKGSPFGFVLAQTRFNANRIYRISDITYTGYDVSFKDVNSTK